MVLCRRCADAALVDALTSARRVRWYPGAGACRISVSVRQRAGVIRLRGVPAACVEHVICSHVTLNVAAVAEYVVHRLAADYGEQQSSKIFTCRQRTDVILKELTEREPALREVWITREQQLSYSWTRTTFTETGQQQVPCFNS